MTSLRNLVVAGMLVSILLILGAQVAPMEAGTCIASACTICRLYRVETTFFGFRRATYDETECSQWYRAHVEPSHTHIWERGTCMTLINAFGRPLGVGCRPGHYPIHLLDPSTQMRVYQHFKDPKKAKSVFANLTDEKTYDDRLDEHDDSKGHLIVRAIQEWEVAGFPGSWEVWWDRCWEKHVAEHKEWLTWLRSDSGMNFWDWKKQKAASGKVQGAGQSVR